MMIAYSHSYKHFKLGSTMPYSYMQNPRLL